MTLRDGTTRAAFALAAVLFAGAVAAAAAQPSDEEVRRVASALIAPCCWTQQASIHQSPAAEQMRTEIRALLAQGRTRDEILQAYVDRYGLRILAEPPDRGFSAILHAWPWATLAASAALLAFVLRRTVRKDDPPIPSSRPAIDPAEQERLDEALRDLD